ncbi:hypothetical protein LSAT2_012629 [Lamellibrachia satsuma]|nr:hypothetical protein LSAT2_012629 [Lamellibrachia satsuma]
MHSRRSRKRGENGAYEAGPSLRSAAGNFIQAWDCREGRSMAMDGSVILCSFLAFALYINTFTADFAYDDRVGRMCEGMEPGEDALKELPVVLSSTSTLFYSLTQPSSLLLERKVPTNILQPALLSQLS